MNREGKEMISWNQYYVVYSNATSKDISSSNFSNKNTNAFSL